MTDTIAPLFSVITAVFDPVPEHLDAAAESVARQRRTLEADDLEHVLVDDASTEPAVSELLTRLSGRPGTVVARRDENGGIVAASNDALERATGEWIVLLDHDDVLADGALAALRRHLTTSPDDDVVYSDHDLVRPDGRFAEPVYKPAFSPERLRQTNYITHLVAIRRRVLEDIGGFRTGTDGAQDHDVLLRAMERGVRFGHVPDVLLHWRQSPRSVSTDPANKPAAFDAGVRVVSEHLQRSGVPATVAPGPYAGTYRIVREADGSALVSVVVPSAGSRGVVWGRERTFVLEAVRSIAARSGHRSLEFVCVLDADTPAHVGEALVDIGREHDVAVRLVAFDETFNFSRKINAGVAAANGDLLLLLNDDTELIDAGSVTHMVALLTADDRVAGPVGAVGAKLLYADGTLQHGGHVYHGEFMHACLGWPGEHPGPHRMFAIDRECSGVTAAALMTTRTVFDAVRGFPEDLPLHFNDVDFCVSVRALGDRILWTPYASWYHFEGRTRTRRASMEEWRRVADRWPGGQPGDPYSNPNLTPKRADWLELPGRSGAPPYVIDADGVRRWG